MLIPKQTKQYKKDIKKIIKNTSDLSELKKVIVKLLNNDILENKYLDHKLKGRYTGNRECHIEPDWLLIYYKTKNSLVLVRTGSHSDLYK